MEKHSIKESYHYEYPQYFEQKKLDLSTELWRTFHDKKISLLERNHEILP